MPPSLKNFNWAIPPINCVRSPKQRTTLSAFFGTNLRTNLQHPASASDARALRWASSSISQRTLEGKMKSYRWLWSHAWRTAHDTTRHNPAVTGKPRIASNKPFLPRGSLWRRQLRNDDVLSTWRDLLWRFPFLVIPFAPYVCWFWYPAMMRLPHVWPDKVDVLLRGPFSLACPL